MIESFQALSFLFLPWIAGMAVAIVAAPLGALIIWRRMAYFGDTLAHSTLLGLVMALLLNIDMYIGLVVVTVAVALAIGGLSKSKKVASDALLGILSHSTLALGLLLAASFHGVRVDLLGYLFGDILAVSREDILWILGVGMFALLTLALSWEKLVNLTIQEDLARVEGVKVERVKLLYLVVLALVFAMAMKLVGVLLITSLLVIPAAAARPLAKTPEQMVLYAMLIGCLVVTIGLGCSLKWDWPTGPAIVVTASLCFFLTLIKSALTDKPA